MKLEIDTSEKTSNFVAEETGKSVTVDFFTEHAAEFSELAEKLIIERLEDKQWWDDETVANEIRKFILGEIGIKVVVKQEDFYHTLLTEPDGKPTEVIDTCVQNMAQ
jgi:hypothetical protein